MEELRESLESYELREPIVLSREPVMEGDSRGQVRDGTHRVSLAIRAKQSQIRAIFKDDLPENDMQQLVLTIELLSGALNDEEESDLLDRFRSWKLDENHWLTSSIIFGSQGRWEIFLDFSKEELSEAIALRAQELLESQFPSSSFSATVALAESFD